MYAYVCVRVRAVGCYLVDTTINNRLTVPMDIGCVMKKIVAVDTKIDITCRTVHYQ